MDNQARRKHERVKNPKVLLKFQTIDRLRSYYLKDLSQGGAFIRLSNPLPIDSYCTVELHAPGLDEPLLLRSRVTRVVSPGSGTEPQGMAVQFDEPDQEKNDRLKKFVESHLQADPVAAPPEAPAPNIQTRGLLDELGLAREAQAAAERRAEEAEERAALLAKDLAAASKGGQKVDSSAGLDSVDKTVSLLQAELERATLELEKKSTEVSDARMELAEVQGRMAAVEEQLHTVERDEETGRMLAERVAADKSKAEKSLRDEVEKARAEAKQLGADLAAARKELAAEKARAADEVQAAKAKAADEVQAAKSKAADEVQAAKAEREKAQEKFADALSQRNASHQAELQQAEEKTSATRAQAKKTQDRVDELEVQKKDVERQLQAAQKSNAGLEKKVADAQGDLERLRKRESALRHLVEVMTAANLTKGSDGAAQTAADEAAMAQGQAPSTSVAPPPPEPEPVVRAKEPEPEVKAKEPEPPPPPSPQRAAGIALPGPDAMLMDEGGGDDEEEDDDGGLGVDVEDDAPAPAAAPPPGVPAFVLVPPSAPPPPVEASSDDSGDIIADDASDPGVAPKEVPVEFDTEFDKNDDDELPALSFDGFASWLERGARMRAVPAFKAESVADPGERMIASMLSEAMPLEELLERAAAHPVRDQFVKMLYGLFQRQLVEVVQQPGVQK